MSQVEYKWALTPRSDLMDLCDTKPEPIALFREERAAKCFGAAMYGKLFEVTELQRQAEGS